MSREFKVNDRVYINEPKLFNQLSGRIWYVDDCAVKVSVTEIGIIFEYSKDRALIHLEHAENERIDADSVPRPYLTTWKAVADDGWIAWGGGNCPVPYGTRVEYKMRNSNIGEDDASYLRWFYMGKSGDIIAYRIHKDQS